MTAVLLAATAGLTVTAIPATVALTGSRDGDGYLWPLRFRARVDAFTKPFIGLVLPGSTLLAGVLVVHGFMGPDYRAWGLAAAGAVGAALAAAAGFAALGGLEWWRDRTNPQVEDETPLIAAHSLIKARRVLRGSR